MRARLLIAISCCALVGLGCSVPEYELGFDDTGLEEDASLDGDEVFVDSGAPDTTPRPDTATSDATDATDATDASDAADSAPPTDAADATDGTPDTTDTAGCGTGPACTGGQTCCSGACVDLATSIPNCGLCGKLCAVGGGTPKCEGSVCKVASCDTGRGDCDGRVDTGCEATLDSTTNCGACGVKCEMPSGIGTCGTGTCAIAGCFSGFDDCNKVLADGCEVNITSDPSNCARCGNVCPAPNGTASCTARVCGIASCSAGFANCDAVVANGCERVMSADANTCATATVLMGAGGITSLCSNNAGQSTTTVSTFGHKFYKVTLQRCSGCSGANPTRAKFVVKSPAGMAFDLRVYTNAGCTTLLGSSTSGTLGGTETVTWSDASCPTPKDFLIEVKWRSGDGCGLATLDVIGGFT